MKYLRRLKSSINKASNETTRFMSAHLRSEARASGWPEHIVSGLHVRHDKGSFTVHSHPEHHQDVMNLEYGTSSTRPNAAIRRFNNRQQEAEKFLMKRAMHHAGGSR